MVHQKKRTIMLRVLFFLISKLRLFLYSTFGSFSVLSGHFLDCFFLLSCSFFRVLFGHLLDCFFLLSCWFFWWFFYWSFLIFWSISLRISCWIFLQTFWRSFSLFSEVDLK